MHRRKFAKTISVSLLSFQLLPSLLSGLANKDYQFLIGKAKTSRFQKIDTHYLEKETAIQFKKMKDAALKDGVDIQIASAFRSFNRQKSIFETKLEALQKENINTLEAIKQIINYSSIPGTSRHHWGTDLDLIEKKESNVDVDDLLSERHYNKGGRFRKLHEWMSKNAASFGFYLAYTNETNRTGYYYEPWHYSYLPSSKKYLNKYLQLNIQKILKDEKLLGFEVIDDDFLEAYISDYVLGINPILK